MYKYRFPADVLLERVCLSSARHTERESFSGYTLFEHFGTREKLQIIAGLVEKQVLYRGESEGGGLK